MQHRIVATLLILVLFLPGAGAVQAAPVQVEQARYYTVRPGDTLYGIAQRYGVSLTNVITTNPQIRNPGQIYPGQRVYIPGRFASQVSTAVNRERTRRGLAPLKLDWELSRVALHKAQDMAHRGYFSHHSPTYGSPFEMMRNYGIRFTYAGENIAKGQRSPEEVMRDWMNSPGHRKNILNTNFDTLGVAYYQGVWVQMFIKKA